MNGAPGELAVADFTASWRSHATGLSHRERGKVVMQHEALFAGAFEGIDELLVLARAERGDDDRLRLSAGEQRRAVRPRQNVHFRYDRAHGLQVAAIDA